MTACVRNQEPASVSYPHVSIDMLRYMYHFPRRDNSRIVVLISIIDASPSLRPLDLSMVALVTFAAVTLERKKILLVAVFGSAMLANLRELRHGKASSPLH